MTEPTDELRAYARKRIKARQDFKQILIVWVAISALAIAVWYFTGITQYFWPGWVMFGIGIGVVVSGFEAYGPRLGVITEQDIDAEVEKLSRR
ncbi:MULTISPECIES: 2TM domain-containing protein [unclassified Diaminobutyricimonas]|uniref:2TM domain-containing protein n=1 Tax=unclassified Diaminobutyricimonas TaxID=2643261 RepID=UPI0012F527C2|nr:MULTISPECIES: 2TM domain-containing protein [unclassified Diaminobutyricimonas]